MSETVTNFVPLRKYSISSHACPTSLEWRRTSHAGHDFCERQDSMTIRTFLSVRQLFKLQRPDAAALSAAFGAVHLPQVETPL